MMSQSYCSATVVETPTEPNRSGLAKIWQKSTIRSVTALDGEFQVFTRRILQYFRNTDRDRPVGFRLGLNNHCRINAKDHRPPLLLLFWEVATSQIFRWGLVCVQGISSGRGKVRWKYSTYCDILPCDSVEGEF